MFFLREAGSPPPRKILGVLQLIAELRQRINNFNVTNPVIVLNLITGLKLSFRYFENCPDSGNSVFRCNKRHIRSECYTEQSEYLYFSLN